MSKHNNPALEPGDRIRVRFGYRLVDGIVTSAQDGLIHVELDVDGTDEPVTGLYRESRLIAI
ncbi:hypothetical protein OG921_03670 [Aldersonia sp. NBC_00410]|uniref:hypothetical protein n=1 Tax=Aldersonia sp. NBC_00410 TaxID=2975954 RepID=UPI0022587D32|nr:hypothetical protein [Aldersonia sp. NBC_00410]MCX5042291.1 hypothetical protein [Aldersonia sp. NBC_00410]